MDIRLKIIIDNLVFSPGLKAEHGFCMFIETPENRIIFDTGQSSLLVENSLKMGIDLGETTMVVISHGHYDHTGGLLSLLEYIGKDIEVYAHPGIFDRKYSGRDKEKIKYIGIPEEKALYQKLGAKFVFVDKPFQIEKNIFISGQIPRLSGFEDVGGAFVRKIGDNFVKDDILDDISFIINTGGGNILITGCSHSGLLNTIDNAQNITGLNEFKLICGGFHLANKGNGYVMDLIKHLEEKEFEAIAPAHCTGTDATCLIKNNFGQKVLECSTGRVFEFNI